MRVRFVIKPAIEIHKIACFLCVLPIRGVHDGGAADLGNLLAMAVEAPTADLVTSDYIFDKEDTVAEA